MNIYIESGKDESIIAYESDFCPRVGEFILIDADTWEVTEVTHCVYRGMPHYADSAYKHGQTTIVVKPKQ